MLRQAFVSPTKPKSWGPASHGKDTTLCSRPCISWKSTMLPLETCYVQNTILSRLSSGPRAGLQPPGYMRRNSAWHFTSCQGVCMPPAPKLDEFFKLIRPQCVLIRGNDDCLSKDFYITLAGILGCCTLTIRIGASQVNQTTLMPRCGECRQLTTVRDRNCNH